MTDFKLIAPYKKFEKQVLEYIEEFLKHNSQINGTAGLHRCNSYDEWLLKLEKSLDVSNIQEDNVPLNTYFLIRKQDSKIIGMITIRHKLNEILLNRGGHIGYSIRPTERKRGCGTLILKLGLEKCRELNLNKVLITCDKINVASAKVIQNNNGILENEVFNELFSEITQRYWISL